MNILIICNAGASSGILAFKINDELKRRGIEGSCIAASEVDLEELMEGKDYILVGPQLRIRFQEFKEIVNGAIPIELIKSQDYGLMNAKGIVDAVLKGLNQ